MNKIINGKVIPLTPTELVAFNATVADPEEALASAKGRLRIERNQLLADTDFLALQDSAPLTTELLEYRKALRDLPATTTDFENPVFPTNPLEG